MKTFLRLLAIGFAFLPLCSCSHAKSSDLDAAKVRAKLDAIPLSEKVHLSDEEWQAVLSPAQFQVMRRAGTERPSSSGNKVENQTGTYVCSACGNPLYAANTKFNSGTGWPSFWQPIRPEAVRSKSKTFGLFGSEIRCARCDSHLGHVFDDGPRPTGLRYCMNAVALKYRGEQ